MNAYIRTYHRQAYIHVNSCKFLSEGNFKLLKFFLVVPHDRECVGGALYEFLLACTEIYVVNRGES